VNLTLVREMEAPVISRGRLSIEGQVAGRKEAREIAAERMVVKIKRAVGGHDEQAETGDCSGDHEHGDESHQIAFQPSAARQPLHG